MGDRKDLAADPYERLANAIILQAAEDYRRAVKKARRDPGNRDAASDVFLAEQFFRSGWYGVLTTVDGEFLIRKLREEALKG